MMLPAMLPAMLQANAVPPNDTTLHFLEWIATALGTAAIVVLGFRVRQTQIIHRIEDLEKALKAHEAEKIAALKALEQQQHITLHVVLLMAKQLGVSPAVDEALVGFLAGDVHPTLAKLSTIEPEHPPTRKDER